MMINLSYLYPERLNSPDALKNIKKAMDWSTENRKIDSTSKPSDVIGSTERFMKSKEERKS